MRLPSSTERSALPHESIALIAHDGSASPRVLVAYASGHGSTKGVAERLGARLAEGGGEVDLRTVEESRA